MFNLYNRDVKFTTQRQKHHPVDDNGNDENTFDHVTKAKPNILNSLHFEFILTTYTLL